MKRLIMGMALAAGLTGVATTRSYCIGDYAVQDEVGNGKIVIANAQKRVGDNWFGDMALFMLLRANLPTAVRTVPAETAARPTAEAVKALDATVAVFVKDDPKDATTILVAPDARWAVVNVAAFDGAGVSAENLSFRVYKGLMRAVCMVCGAGGSRSEDSMMCPMASAADYDRFKMANLPPDVFGMLTTYMTALGVKAVRCESYAQACEEGWAPAPTTPEQKAIWDEVHAMPTEPIKIKPEAKKVTE